MSIDEQNQAIPDLQKIQKAQQKAFENIIYLVEIIRRCETLEDYYYLQEQLEIFIDDVDEAAEDAKQHKAEVERKFYHKLGHQYRTVGDALAWQTYAFQALPIYALGRNQFPGYRTRFKRIGLEEEKKKINMLWEKHGAFALHHDCTNCLRIGDLSIFYPDRLNMPEIDEVKVEGREITSHQKRRIRLASDLAQKHYSTEDANYNLLHKLHISSRVKDLDQTNLGILWQALLQAKENGIGFASNSYLAIAVLDSSKRSAHLIEQLSQDWSKTTYGGPLCQDTKIGLNKSYFPPFNSCVLNVIRSYLVEIHFGWRLVIKGLMQAFLIIKGEIAS